MEINFQAKLSTIGPKKIIIIPLDASKKLPSRGMVMVQGTINNVHFKVPLEPDGKGSHWFEVSDKLSEDLKLEVGEKIALQLEPMKKWLEPEIPKDMRNEIEKENLMNQWNSITTKARWDWLRWIRGTTNSETRKKRIHVACSKLQKGDTNPCCFDRTRCTISDVSKSGVLLKEAYSHQT